MISVRCVTFLCIHHFRVYEGIQNMCIYVHFILPTSFSLFRYFSESSKILTGQGNKIVLLNNKIKNAVCIPLNKFFINSCLHKEKRD